MMRDIDGYCGETNDAETIKPDIEKRWAKEENPVYFLAFAFHPTFRNVASQLIYRSQGTNGSWNSTKNQITVTRLIQAAKFYFGKSNLFSSALPHEQKKELDVLGQNMRLWLLGNDDFDMYECTNDLNVSVWWSHFSFELEPLSTLARFLLDCPVQGATCERLFKDFARYHAKARNRTTHATVHDQKIVLRDLTTKYLNDCIPGSCTFAKNRMVRAKECKRYDVLTSPVAANAANDVNADEDYILQQEEAYGGDVSANDDEQLREPDQSALAYLFQVLETVHEDDCDLKKEALPTEMLKLKVKGLEPMTMLRMPTMRMGMRLCHHISFRSTRQQSVSSTR